MPIDMGFFFLFIQCCCYSSYQIDFYNLLCTKVNLENLNVTEDLKKMAKLHVHILRSLFCNYKTEKITLYFDKFF